MRLNDLTIQIQKIVGTTQDGIWGPATANAVLAKLQGGKKVEPTVSKPSTAVKCIAIDIGHADGTGSRGNGYEEHDECEVIASSLRRQLMKALPDYKIEIIDFPDMDNKGDLSATGKTLKNNEYTLCVSLHCDWDDSPTAKGAHVCYNEAKDKPLAEEIAEYLCDLLPGRSQRLVQRTGLHVLNSSDEPHVLVECGFISNPGDAKIIHEFPDKIAESITKGIVNYINL
jgi:N-acetylmuramoyl-L-alanine amidase